MAQHRVRYGQTIFDVSVQHYGHIEGVACLLEDNADLDINSELQVGRMIQVDESKVIDFQRVKFFRDNRIIVSNFDEDVRVADIYGYWIREDGTYVLDEYGNKILV